jgi:hypothetical protein
MLRIATALHSQGAQQIPSAGHDGPQPEEFRRNRKNTMRFLATLLLLSLMAAAQQQGIQGKVQLTGAASIKATSHAVRFSWNSSLNATSYNVYRGIQHGGPYTKIVSGVIVTSAFDQNPRHGATYYYVVTAVNSQSESAYSTETVAVIP